MRLRLQLEPQHAGRIQANLLDALGRASRAGTLEVAEAIIRRSVSGNQVVITRGSRHIGISCAAALGGPVRCAMIVDTLPGFSF